MVKAIEGIYENGHLVLNETFPTSKKTKVILLVLEEEDSVDTKRKSGELNHPGGVRLGGLAGKYRIPDDFNAPLDDLRDYM
ncbi:hypothetical protein [Spirosoma pomorum]|jgi:hypothetical protein